MNRSTCYIVHPVPSPQFEFRSFNINCNKLILTPSCVRTSLKEKNNSRNPSPPPSSDLSSLSSNSEQEDLVENQPIAQPNEGQLISSDYWVPIATSRAPKRPKKSTKIRERTALPPQSAFAELERSLPPLPDSGRTYPLPDPINLNQGVSPRDVNPMATALALASSASTPVPAHIERLEWNRPQSTAPPLIPIPTVVNRPTTPAVIPTPVETHSENQAPTTNSEERTRINTSRRDPLCTRKHTPTKYLNPTSNKRSSTTSTTIPTPLIPNTMAEAEDEVGGVPTQQ
ncbi:hypothetical protein H4Q26_004126 [Puccinia striiformis f. sp. tritici PST-130]|nr:hypothetical protein H4Q26_004126 [Puccinia striiformis f. sp. tritici PST-130]